MAQDAAIRRGRRAMFNAIDRMPMQVLQAHDRADCARLSAVQSTGQQICSSYYERSNMNTLEWLTYWHCWVIYVSMGLNTSSDVLWVKIETVLCELLSLCEQREITNKE